MAIADVILTSRLKHCVPRWHGKHKDDDTGILVIMTQECDCCGYVVCRSTLLTEGRFTHAPYDECECAHGKCGLVDIAISIQVSSGWTPESGDLGRLPQ